MSDTERLAEVEEANEMLRKGYIDMDQELSRKNAAILLLAKDLRDKARDLNAGAARVAAYTEIADQLSEILRG